MLEYGLYFRSCISQRITCIVNDRIKYTYKFMYKSEALFFLTLHDTFILLKLISSLFDSIRECRVSQWSNNPNNPFS